MRTLYIQWFQSKWRNPQEVVYMDPYIKVILGFVPSTLKPLQLGLQKRELPHLGGPIHRPAAEPLQCSLHGGVAAQCDRFHLSLQSDLQLEGTLNIPQKHPTAHPRAPCGDDLGGVQGPKRR